MSRTVLFITSVILVINSGRAEEIDYGEVFLKILNDIRVNPTDYMKYLKKKFNTHIAGVSIPKKSMKELTEFLEKLRSRSMKMNRGL